MKEGKDVDERFEGSVGAGSLLERAGRDLEIRVPQIQLESIGRLSHHFERFLRRRRMG